MKNPAELERAHDLLTFLLVHSMRSQMQQPGPHFLDGNQIRKLATYTSVLCWCLDHPHNHAFDTVLADVETEFRVRGLCYDPQTRTIFHLQ